jgi:hypothetical protein
MVIRGERGIAVALNQPSPAIFWHCRTKIIDLPGKAGKTKQIRQA